MNYYHSILQNNFLDHNNFTAINNLKVLHKPYKSLKLNSLVLLEIHEIMKNNTQLVHEQIDVYDLLLLKIF